VYMCKIKQDRHLDKTKDEVALLTCFLVDHSVVPCLQINSELE
jgi:hypothetical protein